MILTCPSCGTQYAVKDGAIPPQGRQVRCASCKHAWHQDAEGGAVPAPQEPAEAAPPVDDTQIEDAPGGAFDDAGEAFEEVPADHGPAHAAEPVAPPGEALAEPAAGTGEWSPPVAEPRDEEPTLEETPPPPSGTEEAAYDEDFSPFTVDDDEPRRRSPMLTALIIAVLIAALAAAFWFLAPAGWKERVGIASSGETPLQLMMTHSDRQKLASGNELLAVSGRVINPTDQRQDVPPIRAQLRSTSGRLVYSWTIAPPARSLPPGASATFNSAEVNVPAGGDELTITLGSAKT
jgi:predicted Zn finger-like uncharacterized protein